MNKIKINKLYEDQALEIILNDPKGNVLDGEMMSEITQAAIEEGRLSSVKVLVFRGEGEHFSFGASVPEHRKEYVAEMLATFHKLFRTLIEISKPMIAVVRGQCLGGGLELAAFCHWIFAHENAKFGQPEIKLAVFPPVASLILPFRVGQSAADDLILSGRSISAKEAKTLGLVYSVSQNPEKECEQFIREHILPKSRVALEFAVKSARYHMYRTFIHNIDVVEKMYVKELMAHKDPNEGIQAFMEKRAPVWKDA
ncbi:MAG: cyclohexa-1,5-dienecarbonyl-CoA hydratase [Calditrichaeota bacterium]|nr:MAG: cyclohexa-1,5-dienecarbonyl-CoA hydratase [Calditrichota bacterium]